MSRTKGDPAIDVRAFVKPGMRTVDVGANVGTVSKALAEAVGPTGQVLAIEPHPSCRTPLEALQKTYPQIRYEPYAVVPAPGLVTLYSPTTSSHASLNEKAVLSGHPDPLPVEGRRLDDLVPDGPIDYVKIDVQGAEVGVLRSAPKLLTRCAHWFIEVWPLGLMAHGTDWTELFTILRAADLAIYWADGDLVNDLDFASWARPRNNGTIANLVARR